MEHSKKCSGHPEVPLHFKHFWQTSGCGTAVPKGANFSIFYVDSEYDIIGKKSTMSQHGGNEDWVWRKEKSKKKLFKINIT